MKGRQAETLSLSSIYTGVRDEREHSSKRCIPSFKSHADAPPSSHLHFGISLTSPVGLHGPQYRPAPSRFLPAPSSSCPPAPPPTTSHFSSSLANTPPRSGPPRPRTCLAILRAGAPREGDNSTSSRFVTSHFYMPPSAKLPLSAKWPTLINYFRAFNTQPRPWPPTPQKAVRLRRNLIG